MHLLDYNPDDLDVTISELLVATSDSADPDLPDVVPTVLRMLRTRLGMGTCQGRMCSAAVAEMIAHAHNIPLDQLEPYHAQPPLSPLPGPTGCAAGVRARARPAPVG